VREALAVIEAVAHKSEAARLRRDVRRVTRALGPVRELDVALGELDEAAGRHGWSPDLVAAVHRHVEKERDRRRIRMRARLRHLDLARVARGCHVLSDELADTVTERDWTRAVAGRVSVAAGRALDARDRCGTLYAPERLHALRIAAKKLRYALELAGSLPGVEPAESLALLRSVQERFGHLHDVQVLLGEVEATAAAARRTVLANGLRDIVETLERDCREVHALALAGFPALRTGLVEIRRRANLVARRQRLHMARVPAAADRRPAARTVRRVH
jgi:CHAD domain-containing protein